MAKIYAFVNQKGGVGKTTTAINLGASLVNHDKQVILVDLDAQGNATSSLGFNRADITSGTYSLLTQPQANLVENTLHDGSFDFSLVPASPALAGAEVELVNERDRVTRLQQALTQAKTYDYVLIDCPPSLGLLTLNGLVAAQAVVIPVQCEYLALEGLSQLLETIYRVRRAFNSDLRIRGLLMTMFDSRINLARQVVDEVRGHFPDRVFKTVIPRNVRLAEAPSHGMSITAYDPQSSGAAAYAALAREIVEGDRVARSASV